MDWFTACDEPLGMESNQIWSGNIKASNDRVGYSAYNARLNGASGWSYYLNRQKPHFIQVQVADDDRLTVSGVATQSLGGLYVKLFTLSYSFDNFDWVEYNEDGAVKVRIFISGSAVGTAYISAREDKGHSKR